MAKLLLSFILSCNNLFSQAYLRLDLTGDGWTVADQATGVQVTGRVPGSMYTALLDNGWITDPLFRDNDVKLNYVGLSNWTYSRSFSVSDELVRAQEIWLICEGLDTFASVVINGKRVGQADNMFTMYRFNLSKLLQRENNSIVVQFHSAVGEAAARSKWTPYILPPECLPAVEQGQCHINQIRKEECSFGWDWGPSFPTQGIWKPIYIEAYNKLVIRNLAALVRKVQSQWQVEVQVLFDLGTASHVTGLLNASLASLGVHYSQEADVTPAKYSIRIVLATPKTTNVSLWWPRGYGGQWLYDLDVTFSAGSDLTHKSIRIGFRTVELVQDLVSKRAEDGLTFYFKINAVPVFLKGSNWIPADPFLERVTFDRLHFLLTSAANVSINALRVCGVGIYESEEFYRLCDELGILVWQDLMFSVTTYPAYPDFLDSVQTEVQQQVRRLKHHPSIICWASNNELELALSQNWYGTSNNYTLYYQDYLQLFIKTIRPTVEQEDDTRDFIASSPSNGKESEREGFVAQDPDSELFGDIHFYNYTLDQWNASLLKIPRLASEFGVQAWCNNASLASVFAPDDFKLDSAMASHRQHHENGNEEMKAEVRAHLNLPASSQEKTKFAHFIYLTQINQAMSVRTQAEHYRRHQSQLSSDGRGLTMGALYWQLNDIWQAPTWSSIDYEGQWKMLHYFVKRFFHKQLVSPYFKDKNTMDVFMVVDELPIKEVRSANGRLSFHLASKENDLVMLELNEEQQNLALLHLTTARAGTLNISIYNYNSFVPLYSWITVYKMETTAQSVFTQSLADLLSRSACPAVQDCLLYLTATDSSGQVLSTSWLPLAYPKFSNLLPANVRIHSVYRVADNTFNVQISTEAVSLYVWLWTDNNIKGHFSDNGFVMVTSHVCIQFLAFESVTASFLSSHLRIMSLVDVSIS